MNKGPKIAQRGVYDSIMRSPVHSQIPASVNELDFLKPPQWAAVCHAVILSFTTVCRTPTMCRQRRVSPLLWALLLAPRKPPFALHPFSHQTKPLQNLPLPPTTTDRRATRQGRLKSPLLNRALKREEAFTGRTPPGVLGLSILS